MPECATGESAPKIADLTIELMAVDSSVSGRAEIEVNVIVHNQGIGEPPHVLLHWASAQ